MSAAITPQSGAAPTRSLFLPASFGKSTSEPTGKVAVSARRKVLGSALWCWCIALPLGLAALVALLISWACVDAYRDFRGMPSVEGKDEV